MDFTTSNTDVTTVSFENNLLTGIYQIYAEFIEGHIDEHEFSDLVDLHIELSHVAVA